MKETVSMLKIAVYCGSDFGTNFKHISAAQELGTWIANSGHTLVYGGGDSGLMGIIARAAFEGGSDVIGVIPGNVPFIKERPQPYCTKVVETQDMSSRKRYMLEKADVFIALPGGVGTLDEISEAITLTKIGVFHKPSILFNRDGFYEPLKDCFVKMTESGFLAEEAMKHVLFSDQTSEIESFLKMW